ncbi:hypothetical protein D3C78_1325860 [compost metagenome]
MALRQPLHFSPVIFEQINRHGRIRISLCPIFPRFIYKPGREFMPAIPQLCRRFIKHSRSGEGRYSSPAFEGSGSGQNRFMRQRRICLRYDADKLLHLRRINRFALRHRFYLVGANFKHIFTALQCFYLPQCLLKIINIVRYLKISQGFISEWLSHTCIPPV